LTHEDNVTTYIKDNCIIAKQLRNNLITNNVILVTADRGRTIVAIDDTMYGEKLTDFLNSNPFSVLTKDPTDRYQNQIQQTLVNAGT
jgi:hypothetical protein